MVRLSIWLLATWIACAVESARLAPRNAPLPPEGSIPPASEELNLPQQCLARFPQTRQGPFPRNGQVANGKTLFENDSPDAAWTDSYTGDLDLTPDERSKLQAELKAFDAGYTFASREGPLNEEFSPLHYELCLDAFKEGFEMMYQLGLSATDANLMIRGYRTSWLRFLPDDSEAAATPAGKRGVELAIRDRKIYTADHLIARARGSCLQLGLKRAAEPPPASTAYDPAATMRGMLNGIAVGGCVKELRDKSPYRMIYTTPLYVSCEQYLTCIEWWRRHQRANLRFFEGDRPAMGKGLGPDVKPNDPTSNVIDNINMSGQRLYAAATDSVKQLIKNPPKLSSWMPQAGFRVPPSMRVRGGAPMIKIFPRR